MIYEVRYTRAARADLKRLYKFLLAKDIGIAEKALRAIVGAMKLLQEFPFSCRKAKASDSLLRELLMPFGSHGYVALFEIESEHVTILAVRHQLEEDYL
jgi:plasmid stabilization system protein ParE